MTRKDITGTYQLEKFPKTILQLNEDSTFRFEKNNLNPYLHPFDHPDEHFFITSGRWTKMGKTINLTSQSDSLTYPLAVVRKSDTSGNESLFSFYDTSGDIVPILYVQYSDSSAHMVLHHTMKSFSEDLSKRDTLEFHFYGYRPWTFISGEKKNASYAVLLNPEYRPNIFRQGEFRVKAGRLIGRDRKARFRMIDRGM